MAEGRNKLDALNRENEISELFRIVQSASINRAFCSFAIEGTWGVGKTFILECLEEKLELEQNEETKDNRYFVFHYNCWKYDYYEEPAIAIISVLKDKVENANKICGGVAKDAWKTAEKYIKNMTKEFVKNKIGIDLVQVVEDVRTEGVKRKKEENEFDTLFAFNQTLENVRKQVKELAATKTMVIVVDELDRCMPAYAIKILERLHHMFEGIDNVLVIIAVDSKQLNHSIREIYGDQVDTERYLKKFISFKYNIGIGTAQKSLMEKFEDYFCLFSEYKQIDQTITKFLKLSELDIRTIEKIMTKNKLVHRLVCNSEVSNSVLLYEIMYSVLSYLGSNPKHGYDKIKDYGSDLYWVLELSPETYVSYEEFISEGMMDFLHNMVLDARGSLRYSSDNVVPINETPQGRCIGYMDSVLAKNKKFVFRRHTDEIEVCKKYGKMLMTIS